MDTTLNKRASVLSSAVTRCVVQGVLDDLCQAPWPSVSDFSIDNEGHGVTFSIDISKQLFWFDGHFPEHPVLPGIVQVNWVGEIGRRIYFGGLKFSSLQSVKFQNIIEPGAEVVLRIDNSVEKQRIAFSYSSGECVYSSGRIHFA